MFIGFQVIFFYLYWVQGSFFKGGVKGNFRSSFVVVQVFKGLEKYRVRKNFLIWKVLFCWFFVKMLLGIQEFLILVCF